MQDEQREKPTTVESEVTVDAKTGEPFFVHRCQDCQPVREQYDIKVNPAVPFRERTGQLALRKKTYKERAHRFDTMIRARQSMRQVEVDAPVNDLLGMLYLTREFKVAREAMAESMPVPSNDHALIRIICSKFKDPLFMLEKNVRFPPHMCYDEEYSCDDNEDEGKAPL
jgi:hypothetical protein